VVYTARGAVCQEIIEIIERHSYRSVSITIINRSYRDKMITNHTEGEVPAL
jgi:hypothetical protein